MSATAREYDLIVIGGGAAGFFAAIHAAGGIQSPPRRILVLEKANKALGKVLISGGGRCNLTHACFEARELGGYYPRGGRELRGAFRQYGPGEVMDWFEKRGVPLKTEADGRIFPVSDRSSEVVNCLLAEAQRLGVELRLRRRAGGIQALPEGGFSLTVEDPSRQPPGSEAGQPVQMTARRILLATGGEEGGFRLAQGLGHTIIDPVPSLFSFKIQDARLEGLAGVSLPEARLRLIPKHGKIPDLPGMEQSGALLVTHWGLSGPAVLKLSAWGARWLAEKGYRARLEVNWLGELGQEPVMGVLSRVKKLLELRRKQVANHPPPFTEWGVPAMIPSRLWGRLVEAAGIPPGRRWADLSRESLQRLAEELVQGRYEIQGRGAFKDEFVTCGGVSLEEVDLRTMQSRLAPGLYFAGEVLDVDGLTGGFNLQNAWTTGWIAGSSLLYDT